MNGDALRTAMTARLIDQLYVEAMLLADEARGYFDGRNGGDRERMSPDLRVSFACESLRVTTRLMHVIAWLLSRKANAAGELDAGGADEERRLGPAAESDPLLVALMPEDAREVIASSSDLYARVARLDRELGAAVPASPALTLLGRLEGARF